MRLLGGIKLKQPSKAELDKALKLIDDDLICEASPLIFKQAKWLAQIIVHQRRWQEPVLLCEHGNPVELECWPCDK